MAIIFKDLTYTYQPRTPLAFTALQDVNLEIADHSFTAIIGHTGSGKSTLVQHINGLFRPTQGMVEVGKHKITAQTSNKQLVNLRREVGYVFQFPEAQLFEETVLKDIAFAPKNFGASQEEAEEIARQEARAVKLPDKVLEQSPFELSGGQMRRVAIAGILAMQPKILVLDEPTAGLDPMGRTEIMNLFKQLHAEKNLTTVLVTHNMNDVAEYADHVIVMDKGRVVGDASPKEIFSRPEWLDQHHLGLPQTAQFAQRLVEKGFKFPNGLPLTEDQLAADFKQMLKGRSEDE